MVSIFALYSYIQYQICPKGCVKRYTPFLIQFYVSLLNAQLNIKNKGILISSKRLLEENNTNILQMIKNAGERSKISLIDISHLNDENEIKNKRKKDYQIVVLKEKIIYKLLYLKIKVRYCPVIH